MHSATLREVEKQLGQALPLTADGVRLNAVVQVVESDPELLSVTQLVDRLGLSERALQRLTGRFLGLTPKWLIQRRRLTRRPVTTGRRESS